MKCWHVAKTEESKDKIIETNQISKGRNVGSTDELAHVSLTPFEQGHYALDVIGADTNEAWILELEIPDDVELEEDPSGEGPIYGGDWRVSRDPIPVQEVLKVRHIPDVRSWEAGETED